MMLLAQAKLVPEACCKKCRLDIEAISELSL